MPEKNKSNLYYVGIAFAIVAAALLVMRILVNVLYTPLEKVIHDEWLLEIVVDIIFTVPVQLVVCFALPLFIYKFTMKKSFKKVFEYSNFRKTKPINFLIVIAIGFTAFIVSSGISSLWLTTLEGLGYTYTSSESAMPEKFNILHLLLNLLLTAVFPAFCEEFLNRGAFLTVMRERFPSSAVILLCGLGFGLFHANIEQVLYTACFGMLMGYIVIKTGSIFPAMIVHFINNGISVAFTYILRYGSSGAVNVMNTLFGGAGFLILFIIAIPILTALIFALGYVNRKTAGAVYPMVKPHSRIVTIDLNTGKVVEEDPFRESETFIRPSTDDIDPFDGKPLSEDITHAHRRNYGRMVMNERAVRYVWVDGEWTPKNVRTKKIETVFWIGAIVISSLATIFSLIWGFML